MPAHIKEFVIVNNTGNIFTGDNLSDTSFTATKSYSGSMGCTWIDVVTVIGTETKLCLQPCRFCDDNIYKGHSCWYCNRNKHGAKCKYIGYSASCPEYR